MYVPDCLNDQKVSNKNLNLINSAFNIDQVNLMKYQAEFGPPGGQILENLPPVQGETEGCKKQKRKKISSTLQPPTLKAPHISASMLCIGSWQMRAATKSDLLVKIYFARKKLVWEILRNGLKGKIEIEWSNIIGIQASMKNDLGFLKVKLQNPPKFYKEVDPKPRRHTKWATGPDFTDGQASVNRTHFLVFSSGLEFYTHYQKMISYDNRLRSLPFSTMVSPYFLPTFNYNQAQETNQFEKNTITNFNVLSHVSQFGGSYESLSLPPRQQMHCENNQTGQLASDFDMLTSRGSVVDFNEIDAHQAIQNQSLPLPQQQTHFDPNQIGQLASDFTMLSSQGSCKHSFSQILGSFVADFNEIDAHQATQNQSLPLPQQQTQYDNNQIGQLGCGFNMRASQGSVVEFTEMANHQAIQNEVSEQLMNYQEMNIVRGDQMGSGPTDKHFTPYGQLANYNQNPMRSYEEVAIIEIPNGFNYIEANPMPHSVSVAAQNHNIAAAAADMTYAPNSNEEVVAANLTNSNMISPQDSNDQLLNSDMIDELLRRYDDDLDPLWNI